MISQFEPNIIVKFLWKSGFQLFAELEMTRNENRLFGNHYQTVQFFLILFFDEYGCD